MKALFFIGPFHGHINASFGFASLLQSRGFHVRYALKETFRGKVHDNCFDFSPLTSEVSGRAQKISDLYQIVKKRIILKDKFHKLNKIHWLITNKEFDQLLKDGDCQLIVVDTSTLYYGLVGISKGYKVVVLNPLLSENYNKSVPPYFSKYIPNKKKWDTLLIQSVWALWFLNRLVFNFLCHKLISRSDYFYLPNVIKRLNLDKSIINEKRVWMPGIVGVPELLFYNKQFDFSRSERSDEWYVGPLVYEKRKENVNEFDWKNIIYNNKKIVYCCMGTLAIANYKYVFRLLQKIINVFSSKELYELIISTGGESWKNKLDDSAENVHVYVNVPQLEVLSKASLMINHGGGNSVRECIAAGVPMVCIPLSRYTDQYGFASRVDYHKIGLLANKNSSGKTILKKSLEVLSNLNFEKNINKMKLVFFGKNSKEEEQLIESILNYIER